MQYNICHNRNIKLIITILQKYSTGLQRFGGIETKFKFKFKLNLNYKLNKIRNLKHGNSSGPISLKETEPATAFQSGPHERVAQAVLHGSGLARSPCGLRSPWGRGVGE
jgi:hypothetical protein